MEFVTMLRDRKGTELKAWIEKALTSDLAELKSFARGLKSDYETVLAGISTPWSNGQVEGQVNRLKFVKRRGYGRTTLEFLRLRVLRPARS